MHLSFLALALKRARCHALLTLLGVVGVALVVGLLASISVFSESVGMQILRQELIEDAYGNVSPPLAMRYYRVPSAPSTMTVQEALDTGAWLAGLTHREVGLPITRRYIQLGSHAFIIKPMAGDTHYTQNELGLTRINCIVDIEDQINITEGTPFTEADAANELVVWARPELIEKLGFQIGERYEFFNYNALHPDQPLLARIGGIWQAKDPEGAFWYNNPHKFMDLDLLTSIGAFARFVAPIMPQQIDYSFWYYILDDHRLRLDEVEAYAKGTEIAQFKAQSAMPDLRVDRSPIEPLRQAERRSDILERLLMGFALPVAGLALVFIASVAVISVHYQQREQAILNSRGASRPQILGINIFEGLLHLALGMPLGLIAMLTIARGMSLNTSFLAFDRPASLPLVTQGLKWPLVLASLAVSLLARLLPTIRLSGSTIVSYGREHARQTHTRWSLRLASIALMTAASAYAYNRVRSRGTFGIISWQPGGETVNDPLLVLAPILFIFTVGVVAAGMFPIIMHLPNFLASFLSPSLYLGARNLARRTGAYTTSLFLLVFCLCLGSFVASAARSSDAWLDDRLHYRVGADYSFLLTVDASDGLGTPRGADSWLLPIAEYRRLPGVVDAARVGEFLAEAPVRFSPAIRLMGVDRIDFGRVAHWRYDYAGQPLGELLNLLAGEPNGMLVSRRYLEATGLGLGDRLPLTVYVEGIPQEMSFVIAGTYEYFPTFYPDQRPLAVTNLDYIFDQVGGNHPFYVWLRTVPGADVEALRLALDEMSVVTTKDQDARAMIAKDREQLERVGIYGTLTVGFLASSVLAWIALLVHSVASLLERVRDLAVLRALGASMLQIMGALAVEYLGITVSGILVGVAAGVAMARLYVPFFQFTDRVVLQVPPFMPYIAWTRILWLAAAYFAFVSISGLTMLVWMARQRLSEGLRMGE